jgi:hypothetical protein
MEKVRYRRANVALETSSRQHQLEFHTDIDVKMTSVIALEDLDIRVAANQDHRTLSLQWLPLASTITRIEIKAINEEYITIMLASVAKRTR